MMSSETPSPADPLFTRLEIEGIPAFVTANAPRYAGLLLFRTGRADEPLRHTGLSHLVEHLALFHLGAHQPYAFNGWVGSLFTCFHATGTPDEVGTFLNAVAKGLRSLPLERLQDEARVLRTEAAARSAGPAGELLWFRYGANGHGAVTLPEFELADPNPDAVREWAGSRFTAGNAALWFSGKPPENLDLNLPAGTRIAPPAPVPVPDIFYPAFVYASPGVIGMSFVAPRSDWLSVPLGIAAERLRSRLRFERGMLYDVAVQYEPISKDTAHACIWAGCLPEHETAVRDGLVQVIEEIARSGATPEELDRVRERYRRSRGDAEFAADAMMGAAMDELLCGPARPADLVRELDALDSVEVARRVAAALDTALLRLPPTCPPPSARFLGYPTWSKSVASGRSYRARSALMPWSRAPRLVIGKESASIVTPDGGAITVNYASCRVALLFPGGALEMYGQDGFRIRVEPQYWRDGEKAVSELLELLPAECLLRVPTVTL
jgi:zinc protease